MTIRASSVPIVIAISASAALTSRVALAVTTPPPRSPAGDTRSTPDATQLPPLVVRNHDFPLPAAKEDMAAEAPPSAPAAVSAADAKADEEDLGRRGHVVITGDFVLGASSSSYSEGDALVSDVKIAPSLDVFVVNRLSVGAELGYARHVEQSYYSDGTLGRSQSDGGSGGARVGYAVPLAGALWWWPRVTLGYSAARTDRSVVTATANNTSVAPTGTTDEHGAYVSCFAPLVFRAAPRFVLGFGPSFYRDLARTYTTNGSTHENDATTLGVGLLVGGWL